MRRSFTKFHSSSPFISFASPFSTSSSGRGRGRVFISPNVNFTKEHDSTPPSASSSSENEHPYLGFGHGHLSGGREADRGKASSPETSSSSSSFVAKPGSGRGRGLVLGVGSGGPISPPSPAPPSDPIRRSPGDVSDAQVASTLARPRNSDEGYLPSSIFPILTGGAGRGKAPNPLPPSMVSSDKPKEENRHIRARKPQDRREDSAAPQPQPQKQRLSQEEAVKKAIGILSRGGDGGLVARGGRGGAFRGGRGRGMQVWRGGRGGGGRGRGRGRGELSGRSLEYASDDDYATGLNLGDDADGEKLAKRLGPDVMNMLAEGFEDMTNRVLPSPVDDAYEDALRTNLMIECEPEYLMGDFASNPDIDEKPPMSLTDALEKMKPFLMAYENIRTHQEWEEAIEETMKNVPHLKEIVDLYSGPDRVTAKQQKEELERVSKMIPESAPASIKRFTNNAVLSLQSNPGWRFDKKCQLMDKLVQEVSQQYK